MTTYRQRLTSSVYAISQSLKHRLETLRAQRTVLAGRERARDRDYGDAEQVVLETLQNADLDDGDVLMNSTLVATTWTSLNSSRA